MIISNIDTSKETLVIAEIGNNHEGDIEVAKDMIHGVASTGAQAVKFQTFQVQHFVSAANKDRYEMLQRFELTQDEFRELAELANSLGLIFLSTPLDLGSAHFLNEIVPAFKIGSGENTFYPLLECVARFEKPIILSTGLATMDEIHYSVELVNKCWSGMKVSPGLAVLHCVTSYPVEPHELNLKAIRSLQEALTATIGYSDHSLSIEPALLAVALGARIIERHFTLDKNMSEFRDHKISSTPDELSELVRRIEEVSTWLGSGNPYPQESEQQVRDQVRRSIVSGRDLPQGTTLQWGDLSWVRPSSGLKPGQEDLILGRKLLKDLKAGELILPEFLSSEN